MSGCRKMSSSSDEIRRDGFICTKYICLFAPNVRDELNMKSFQAKKGRKNKNTFCHHMNEEALSFFSRMLRPGELNFPQFSGTRLKKKEDFCSNFSFYLRHIFFAPDLHSKWRSIGRLKTFNSPFKAEKCCCEIK